MAFRCYFGRKIESKFSLPIIQMGARIYLPTLGRFAQVDPIEGGAENNYVYANDPINSHDYSGQFVQFVILGGLAIRAAAPLAPVVAKQFIKQGAKQAAPRMIARQVVPKTLQQSATKYVVNGREMVRSNGYTMTNYYHSKLLATGRSDFAKKSTDILNSPLSYAGRDPKGYPGFNRYIHDGWELVYNPFTKEISHLAPIK
jgi:RHS repeat-associated protein